MCLAAKGCGRTHFFVGEIKEVKIDLTYCHKNPYIYVNPFVIIQKNTGMNVEHEFCREWNVKHEM